MLMNVLSLTSSDKIVRSVLHFKIAYNRRQLQLFAYHRHFYRNIITSKLSEMSMVENAKKLAAYTAVENHVKVRLE